MAKESTSTESAVKVWFDWHRMLWRCRGTFAAGELLSLGNLRLAIESESGAGLTEGKDKEGIGSALGVTGPIENQLMWARSFYQ